VGRDTRPTGKAIAKAIIPALLEEGWTVRLVNESAAPEIMAYARSLGNEVPGDGRPMDEYPGETEPAVGFIYISASHNPVGHNGLTFGFTDGGVLPGTEVAVLIDRLKALLGSGECIARLETLLSKPDTENLRQVISQSFTYKKEALKAYEVFTRKVIAGFTAEREVDEVFSVIRRGLTEYPLGICADFNGSARTVSIDREFLTGLGIEFISINDIPGIIQHRIIPEGESLEPCKILLEACHREKPHFVLGYVPDCDGDRGNLVIWDSGRNQARTLEAQEVFALACVAELAYLVWTGQLRYDEKGNAVTRAALVVNDPTSLRIDRIGRAFDVPVFRAEVGEANVVGLARKLREEGYVVRILGEGSNGGNITHPAAVRDPLNTLGALIKILSIRSRDNRKGLYELWCDRFGQYNRAGQGGTYREDFTLGDIIASLPAYVTTQTSSEEAILKIKTIDHSLLKEKYQKVFLDSWEARKGELNAKYGIAGWDVCAYKGIEEIPGISRFGEAGRGGLKIGFLNNEGRKIACVWMRGSGTEAVFRIMADAEGSDSRLERDLIEWQRRMIAEADED
jgi:phosphoglucomutase